MLREGSQQSSHSGPLSRNSGSSSGVLFIVGVPIGHPDDITLRALSTLRDADIIASENPEATQALLRHHGLHATVTSYGPVNLREKIGVLIQRLGDGARVALVSDCGSPVVSDPGSRLITAAHARSIRICSIPGPSAITAAVAAAGLLDDIWLFGGQLPESTRALHTRLSRILAHTFATVAFCTPASLSATVRFVAERAPARLLCLACNLTRPEEIVLKGTAASLRRRLIQHPITGDVTLIVAGKKRTQKPRPMRKRPAR